MSTMSRCTWSSILSWSYGNSYKTKKRAASAVATVALAELPVPGGANGRGAAETSSHWQLPGAADADVGWLATTLVVEQELVEALMILTAGKLEMRLGRHGDMIMSWFCITKFIKSWCMSYIFGYIHLILTKRCHLCCTNLTIDHGQLLQHHCNSCSQGTHQTCGGRFSRPARESAKSQNQSLC